MKTIPTMNDPTIKLRWWGLKIGLLCVGLMLYFSHSMAQNPQLETQWWQPDGAVNAVIKSGDTVFVGGAFSSISTDEAYFSKIDSASGIPDISSLNPNGEVKVIIPDGNGGWYLGGTFTKVGDQNRYRVAQIDASGQLTSFAPTGFNNNVNTLLLRNDTLFAGGDFTYVGPDEPYGAILDSATGMPDLNFLDINTTVWASLPDGSGGWYIGGDFSQIKGQSRNRLARINADGTLHPWNPDVDGTVRAIARIGNTIFVGGYFTTVGGQSRINLALVDATSGIVLASAPNPNNYVFALLATDNKVYVGGDFTNISGVIRYRIAALDATGQLTSFAPAGFNGTVHSIAIRNDTLYAGGGFTYVGPDEPYGAILDSATGMPDLTFLGINSTIWASIPDGNGGWYIGGDFTSVGGQTRNRLARINADGTLHPWNPNANNQVLSIAKNGATLYLGGSFTNVGGQTRNRLAAVDTATGALQSWNPAANNVVRVMTISDTSLYIGGDFTSTNSTSRTRIAAYSLNTGALRSWSVNTTNGTVRAIAVKGDTVFLEEILPRQRVRLETIWQP
jgi:hypothetical protein